MYNGDLKFLVPSIAATILEYAEKLDKKNKTEASAFSNTQLVLYSVYKERQTTAFDVFADAMQVYWQNRIGKDKGQKALDAFHGTQYMERLSGENERMTAREFYIAGNLIRDAVIFNMIPENFGTGDETETHAALASFSKWFAEPARDYKKCQELRENFDKVINNLVKMDQYIDDKFSGNILCEAIYYRSQDLFDTLLDTPWVNIDEQHTNGESVLYFLLYTREFHNTFSDSGTPIVLKTLDDMLDMLLARGIKVDNASKTAWSPLIYAAASGSAEVVKKLLKAGADVHWAQVGAREDEPKTALEWAKKYKKFDVVAVLEEHIATLGQSSPSIRRN